MTDENTRYALMMEYRYYIRTTPDYETALWDSQCKPHTWKTQAGAERAALKIQKLKGDHKGHKLTVVEVSPR